jgi:hypothetical protein
LQSKWIALLKFLTVFFTGLPTFSSALKRRALRELAAPASARFTDPRSVKQGFVIYNEAGEIIAGA